MKIKNWMEQKSAIQKRKSLIHFLFGCAFSFMVLALIDRFVISSILAADVNLFAMAVMQLLHDVLRILAIPFVFLAMHWWVYRT